jgi:hypothetical protein
MKTALYSVSAHRPGSPRQAERGTAVVVVLVYLAIVFACVASNARTLHSLGRELRLIERRQVHRLSAPPPQRHDKARDKARSSYGVSGHRQDSAMAGQPGQLGDCPAH